MRECRPRRRLRDSQRAIGLALAEADAAILRVKRESLAQTFI